MKIRNGFVSNSSSSSFTCDVCGHTTSGWDLALDDAGMYECSLGHYYCDNHKLKATLTLEEMRKELLLAAYSDNKKTEIENTPNENIPDLYKETDWKEGGEGRYMGASCYCPVCQIQALPDSDLVKWFLLENKMTRQDAIVCVKEQYKTYQKFKDTIAPKKEKKQ